MARCFLIIGVLLVARADGTVAAGDDRFQNQIVPLLSKYCTACHSGEEPKGNLALDQLKGAQTPKDRESLELVLDMLDSRSMPPKNKPQPSDAERRVVLDWIRANLEAFDCSGPRNPGRVTIRRLNRVEYNNTIRDLVGVDFQPADDFPTDDVGYGFDNIGDVLTVSPLLVEKYLSAAELIAEKAILANPPRGSVRQIGGRDLQGGDRFGTRVMVSRKPALAKHTIVKSGSYTIRIRGFSARVVGESPRLVLRLGERELMNAAVVGTRDAPRVLEVSTELEAGAHTFSLSDARVAADAESGEPDSPGPLIMIDSLEIAEQVSLPDSHRRIITVTPSAEMASDRCARLILTPFATRAFRRPVSADEVERYVRLVLFAQEKGDTFERGIQLAVAALLTSPHFLFRVEADADPADEDGIRELNDYEIATRLSYFLWSTMPDDGLMAVARQGKLRESATLEAEVRRMLRDPKATALVENFAGQWLQLRDIAKITPDPELFPDFDDSLRAAMLQETQLLFESIVKEDRSVLEFLDADYTYVNERLARHYGLADEVKGDEFRRVKLPGNQRRGVLTHASVLALTSNPTRTSPVKRGKWILDNVLGTPPPPPPPGVDELNEDEGAQLFGSLRKRMEQHREKAMCATCHNRMDPLGFAFENFDAIGAWRDMDGKFAVDASGELPNGDSFQGPVELARHLVSAKREQFSTCLTEKMLTYGLGRGLDYYDKCTVDDILKRLAREDCRFSSLILGIVESDAFQKRGRKGGDE